MNDPQAPLPEATVIPAGRRNGPQRYATRLWVLTLFCLAAAVTLVYYSLPPKGMPVTVRFEQGYGLDRGDPVRFRGIEVGRVETIRIDEQHEGIEVEVRLLEHAGRIARAGARFWIERPRFDLGAIGGLDTLIGGRYLAVQPGPATAPPLKRFEGLEAPPAGPTPEGGLDIVLESTQRNGLTPGAPITYRGIAIGRVLELGLAGDAATVEARAYIEPAYRSLVRTNTRFWTQGGFNVDVGLTGIRMNIEEVSTLLQGKLALATPSEPGPPAPIGHRFVLHDEPDEDWLAWQPRIGIGAHMLPDGRTLPQPVRAALHWKDRTLGVRRERQVRGWLLPLEDGRFLGPADLLSAPEDVKSEVFLDLTGVTLPLDEVRIRPHGEWATILPGTAVPPPADVWSRTLFRHPDLPEDVLLIGNPASVPVALSASRLTATETGWDLDPSLSLPTDLHGATVLAVRDGAVLGVLMVRESPGRIVLVDPDRAAETIPGEA